MAEMKIIVQKIDRIESHPNADRLEIAFTDIFDWPVIVGKDSFKPGDKVIHFPVDCVVDEKMEELLLGGSKLKLKAGRIRAAKIRGIVSYGILAPTEKILNNYTPKFKDFDNLMSVLGCYKYEPPVKVSTTSTGQQTGKRQNRNFDKYFNMNHLQNCKGIFGNQEELVVTEKLHGTSFRAGWVKRDITGFKGRISHFFRKIFQKDADWEFVYGSRNVQLQNTLDKSIYKTITDKYDLKNKIPKGFGVYGEIVGPGIQKGYSYTKELSLFVYDVKSGSEYLDWRNRIPICRDIEVPMVPVISADTPLSEIDLEKIWEKGSAFDEIIEGVVIETVTGRIDQLGRTKVKVINPEYLLNKDNTDFH